MGKRILITGKNSYIGTSFSNYVSGQDYVVDELNVVGDSWKSADFSGYDVVLHVAAIVHRQETRYTKGEYDKVNTDLVFDVAKKAKDSGVKQFVFLSSMSVYGMMTGVITSDAPLKPYNQYGYSKRAAERKLKELSSDDFIITVLRPPLVYGKNCKGNYNLLKNFAVKFPFFPDYKSYRSVIYIENLASFIKKAIDDELCGVFCPQDKEYIIVSDMVKKVAQANGKNIKLTKIFNPFIKIALGLRIGIICKVFGTLTYDKSLCVDFDRVDFDTAIRKTEE